MDNVWVVIGADTEFNLKGSTVRKLEIIYYSNGSLTLFLFNRRNVSIASKTA